MKLTKYEQSGFLIEAKDGFALAVDIGAYTPVDKLASVTADAVLVSHLHGDHLSAEQISALSPREAYLSAECQAAVGSPLPLGIEIVTIRSGEPFAIGPFKVEAFDVDHGPNVSVKPKENFGFLIEADGERLYFGGDIFYPSGLDTKELEVDTALIPVGGFYTFGPQEALDFALSFKKLSRTVPMHWNPKPENKDVFLALAREKGLHAEAL